MNRYVLLAIALGLGATACKEDPATTKVVDPYTGPVAYDVALGTGEEDDATGCLQMGASNVEDVAFGATETRIDEDGNLSNAQCVIGIILREDNAYFIAGPDHDVVLDDQRVAWLAGEVEQVAEEGELGLRIYENNAYEDGDPLFVGRLLVTSLDLEGSTAQIAAD